MQDSKPRRTSHAPRDLAAGGAAAATKELRPKTRRPGSRYGAYLRVPIALKFTGFITALVVVFMSWQTYVATAAATKSLEEEINRGGITLITALSTLLDPVWIGDPRSRGQLVAVLDRVSRSKGADRILNIVVDDLKGPIATARGESMISRTGGSLVNDLTAEEAGVEIWEFTYGGTRVRSFATPLYLTTGARSGSEPPGEATEGALTRQAQIPSAEDGRIGRVEAYVSAKEIAEARKKLAQGTIQVALVACGIAAVGAFLLARFMTSPIRGLLKDMKQVSLGNLDHEAAVTSSDEMGDLARAFNAMTAGLKSAEEAKLAQKTMEHELSLASKIQTNLLPSSTPRIDGYDMAVHYSPAKEVSGDYYDFVKVDERHLGVVVADVSGKGVPAALVMTMTRSLLRLASRGEIAPERTVDLVNRILTPDLKRGMFVTLVYYVLDPASRRIELVRAGHNAPLLYVASQKRIVTVQPGGMGLGLDRKGSLFSSQLEVARLELASNDVLLTYTDGIVEAKNKNDEEYTTERLSRILEKTATSDSEEIVRQVIEDVATHQRDREPADDITVVALKAR